MLLSFETIKYVVRNRQDEFEHPQNSELRLALAFNKAALVFDEVEEWQSKSLRQANKMGVLVIMKQITAC